MPHVRGNSKNILATALSKVKYALVLVEGDPLFNQISGIWLIRLDQSHIKEAVLLVEIVACSSTLMFMV